MKYHLFICLSLLCTFAFSQEYKENDPFYVSEHIPKSPEVSSLGEFGAIQASSYNGKANIGVPIHTINWEGLSIPIQLNYDNGGVRVASEATWVGLNWSLSVNFGISRSIYGQDDFKKKSAGVYQESPIHNGYIYNPYELDLEEGTSRPYFDLSEIYDVHHSFSLTNVEGRASSHMDTQPDLFTINVFGGTYKFILNKKGGGNILTTKVFNNKNAIVTYDLGNDSFTLVDENGFTYHFITKDVSTNFSTVQGNNGSTPPSSYLSCIRDIFATSNRSDAGIITNWSLDSVTSPRGRTLDFTYQKGLHFTFPQYDISGQGRDNYIFSSWPNEQYHYPFIPGVHNVSTSIIENNYLTSISGEFGEIKFNLASRQDLSTGHTINELAQGGFGTMVLITEQNQIRSCHGSNATCGTSTSLLPWRLDNIQILNSENKEVVLANLHHSYFNQDDINSSIPERYLRLKLDGISINNIQDYSFSYISPNDLTAKDSFGIDFWGFANGKESNTTKVPRIGRFITSLLSVPSHLFSGANSTIGQSFVKYDGADRSSDFSYGIKGTLNEIIYPTKGKTVFTYEPHQVVLDAPTPFEETKNFTDYSGYSGSSRLRWTNMLDESKFKTTYQYMKCATDPGYNYFEKEIPEIQGDPITVPLGLGQSFNVDFPSLVLVEGYMKTHTGWDGLNFFASYPRVVVTNLDTGQETTVFTYGDAPNDYGNSSAINYLSKSINLAPGSYAILTKSIPPPPDGDYSTYPPQPAVEYHSTNIDLFTFESISDEALSNFVEQFEVGGVRVQRIHNEDYNGRFLNATRYNYNYPSAPEEISSSGKLMDDLIFHSKASGFHSYNPRGYGSSPLILTGYNVVGVNNSAQGSHIGYSFVQEIQEDANGNHKGWIEKDYHNQGNLYFTDSFNLPYQYDTLEGDGDPYIKVFGIKTKWFCSGLDLGNDCAGTVRNTSSHGYVSIDNTLLLGLPTRMDFGYVNGNILEQRVFNLDGDILEKTENTYHSLNGEISLDYFSSFMNVGIPFTSDSWQGENGISANVWSSWEEGMWGANHHTYYPYQFPIHHGLVSKLSKTVNYKYFNSDEFITESRNFYDEDTHHVKSTIQIIDENDQISSHLFYPYDAEVFSSPHMSNLRNENRLSTIVKTEQYKNDVKLSTVEYSYDRSNNTSWKTLISKTKQSKGENNLETRINYLQYDNFGNLLEKNIEGEVHTTYLWGYNGQFPVAKIENATLDQVANAVGLSVSTIKSNGIQNISSLNNLRQNLTGALATTYTYDPLIGVISITDARGETIYYHYDELNRLEYVKDAQNKILSKNEYNYKN